MIAALHQENYATIANYLERELRYMDAGEQGSKALAGPHADRGTDSHVIHHYFGNRHAVPALGGADVRRSREHRTGRGRADRDPDVSRLRIGLGRLHARRICRPAAAHVWLRLQ